MKKLILNSLFFFGFLLILSTNLSAQNLQFNQVVYNTYGPFISDGNLNTPLFSSTLTVGPNQVLKVVTAFCSTNSSAPVAGNGWMFIDNVLVNYEFNNVLFNNVNEIWYPTGTYTVIGYEFLNGITTQNTKCMISGILYDIVP